MLTNFSLHRIRLMIHSIFCKCGSVCKGLERLNRQTLEVLGHVQCATTALILWTVWTSEWILEKFIHIQQIVALRQITSKKILVLRTNFDSRKHAANSLLKFCVLTAPFLSPPLINFVQGDLDSSSWWNRFHWQAHELGYRQEWCAGAIERTS